MSANVTPTPPRNSGPLRRKARPLIFAALIFAAPAAIGALTLPAANAAPVTASGAARATIPTVRSASPACDGVALNLTGLTLKMTWQKITGLTAAGGARVGTDDNYRMSITASDGKVIGTDVGNSLINYIDPATKHVFVHIAEKVTIDGGVFEDSSEVDATAGYSGTIEDYNVHGISGKLAGDVGIFQYIPTVKPTLSLNWYAKADIHLAPGSVTAGDTFPPGLPY